MVQTKNPVIEDLQERIKKAGSQKALADELEIHPSYLNDILQGKRNPGEDLLKKLGYEKVVVHVKLHAVDAVIRAIETAQTESTTKPTNKK